MTRQTSHNRPYRFDIQTKSLFAKTVATNMNMIRRSFFRCFFKNRLIILMYHGVVNEPLSVPDWCFIGSQDFLEQLRYLKANFDVLPLSQAVNKLQAGNIQNPTVSVTFDDGFLNNYEVAYPITSKLQIPITIFVSTQFVDTNRTLWYCRLNMALSKTRKKHVIWRGVRYSIENVSQKSKLSSLLQRELKKMTHVALLDETDKIIAALGLDADAELDPKSPFKVLSSEAIRLMSQSGSVEIGAHTHSHAILSRLEPDEKREEILNSVRLVENWTNSSCKAFAYPNGRFEDYDAACIQLLRDHHIENAVTGNAHSNVPATSRLELGRYGIGSDTALGSFKLLVHGITPAVKRFGSKYLSKVNARRDGNLRMR